MNTNFTFGQWFILGALIFKCITAAGFSLTYGILAPWYRSVIGKQVMFLSLSLIMFPAYVVVVSFFPPGGNRQLVQISMGIAIIPTCIALVIQTMMVYRVQKEGKSAHGKPHDPNSDT